MDTPILLLIWRRPHTLRRVIDAIRPVAPSRLFVACDGPSENRLDEAEKVSATQSVIDTQINWPCHIERLYSATNQGCRLGVSRAISWFFEHVSEGIILEDDCLPHPDFFKFTTTLLERYRYDKRVWSICGSNFQLGNNRGNSSYYFSRYPDPWGWATWKRCWQLYDDDLDGWKILRDANVLSTIFKNRIEIQYWKSIFDNLLETNTPDSWAYRWICSGFIQGTVNAWPNVPLIRNIGFDKDATHTHDSNPFESQEIGGLGILIHPTSLEVDQSADRFAFLHRFDGMRLEEEARYTILYPWLLRYRKLKSMGIADYLSSHF